MGFREEEVGIPQANEILVETLYTGISHGTEMLVYRGEVAPGLELDPSLKTFKGCFGFPIKYGYSNVGRIIELGSRVSGLRKGDIVFAHNPHETIYTISENQAMKLPEAVLPSWGIFIASVETAINCVWDANIHLGESVVIFGQGIIGLLITQLMRISGAGRIFTVDKLEKRRNISQKLGADFAFDPNKANLPSVITELTDGIGADVIIEASGSPDALDSALKLAAFQGTVVVVSWYGTKPVTLNLGEDFHRERVKIKSSQVSFVDPSLTPRWNIGRRMALALKILPQLNLKELISHIYPFEEAPSAYDKIDKNPEEVLQVILRYV